MRYKQYYVDNHANDPQFFTGMKTTIYVERIKKLIEITESRDILDYGCGKGHQYDQLSYGTYWKANVDCYDPAVPSFETLPDKWYDGVICVDVLDLVPEEEIDQVLNNIFSRALKFAYIAIHDLPKNRTFADGQDISVTRKSQAWWDEKIIQHNVNRIIVSGALVTDYPVSLELGDLMLD
ncbi:hypothetical protein UFOVP247_72 [uncultured Caudovirales phage]|uniref:Uncharacterized protein n=1 Tax=uncultured Caudovirales phage TaxID=2100421 RepID=A0A6J7WSH7_9CAUD|nr:hypothetical protein UFOVP247_72 [uncultured Caudovirales phage]